MADLWSQLSDTLAASSLAALSAYADYLRPWQVEIDSRWDFDALLEIAPALVLYPVDCSETIGDTHGGLRLPVDFTYHYELRALVESESKDSIRRDATKIRQRLLAWLRSNDLRTAIQTLSGDDGERVRPPWIEFDRSATPIYEGRADEDYGPYTAVCIVRFGILTSAL